MHSQQSKCLSMVLQQSLIGFLGLAFSVVIFRKAGFDHDIIVQKLQLVLFAYAVGTFLQAFYFKTVPIGTGMMLAPVSGAIYVQPSILALAIGGVPLLIGMTIFAGLCEFLLSFIIRKTKAVFPPEICGLVLLLVGLQLGATSIETSLKPNYINHSLIMIATLFPIVIFTVWGKGYIRHICSIIGVISGFVVTYLLGDNMIGNHIPQQTDLIALPSLANIFHQHHITFNWSLSLPFFLVGFAASIRTLGLTISLQQAQDSNWKKPDYNIIQRSMRSDGLASMFAGLLGINGLNVSPTSTTMAIAFRYTHVKVAFYMSIVFLILSCMPSLLYYIANSPLPIVGGLLLYYAAFIFTGGIRTIGAQSFGARQVFSIGISFCIAVSTYVIPDVYQALPEPFNVFARSSLAIGLIFAVLLNLLFLIGTSRSAKFILQVKNTPDSLINEKVSHYGNAWNLKQDMVHDATLIAKELVYEIQHAELSESDIIVGVHSNSTSLKVTLSYIGTPFKMILAKKIDTDKSLDEEVFIDGLKAHLQGMRPSKITSTVSNNDECSITAWFEY